MLGSGGPFFVYDENEAAEIEFELVPVEGALAIDGSPSFGMADVIFTHGKETHHRANQERPADGIGYQDNGASHLDQWVASGLVDRGAGHQARTGETFRRGVL